MKHKNHKHLSIHQRIERTLQHRTSVGFVAILMFLGVLALDGRYRSIMQQMYAQGWSWIGTYMHHEHPAHAHGRYGIARMARITGPDE